MPKTGEDHGYVYGNGEFRLSSLYDAMVHKVSHKVKKGDVVTVTYEDCALNAPLVVTHTVNSSQYKPISEVTIRRKPGGTDCEKNRYYH